MHKLGSFTEERSEFFCSSTLATPMKAALALIAALLLISASSVDSGPRFRFLDATIESGLGSFRHLSGNPRDKRYILEVMSGGVAIFDYDNDGLPDVYLVNGSTLDSLRGKARPDPNAKSRLFRNLGKGKFEDVTPRAGVDNFGHWGMGACAADYDNDGRTDLFVTNAFGRNVLYRNNGDGTFSDVTQKAKIGGEPGHWSAGSAWADYDNDGYVDLFVAGYVDLDLNNLPDPGTNQYCRFRGLPVNCGPRGLKGARDYLYHNNRDGTFTEVSDKAGVDDKPGYYGLGCVWADFDNDGLIDLYVANDSTPNYLYHNNGNGTFKDIGFDAGAAVNEDGREQASMGVDAGDYDGDGYFDIFTTNFVDDYSTLYHNDAGKEFSDVSNPSGLAAPGWTFLKWGTGFVDFDNDGRPDVFVANGHIYPEIEGKGFGQTFGQRNQLFENLGDGRFREVREETLDRITKVSRGAAFADLDGDGRLDIVINNMDDQPTLLLNRGAAAGNWIEFKLVGRISNRDAVGARVKITAGGRDQIAEVKAGHSYLSQSDLKVHFGLGSAKTIDAVTVQWPGGGLQKLSDVSPNQVLRIEEQVTAKK
jgi:enediyne biosynthesis protein E4